MNPSQPKTQTKYEEETEGKEGEEKEVGSQKEECGAAKETSNKTGSHNNLELRLGIPSSNRSSIFDPTFSFPTGFKRGDEAARAAAIRSMLSSRLRTNGLDGLGWLFSDPPNGFIDPWSLAARQQKAVLEQAHKNTSNSSSTPPSLVLPRAAQLPPQSVAVGWPPVGSFRRSMVGSQATRPDAEDERKAKRAKLGEEEAFNDYDESNGTMFVKVNMEGYAVGRKIDLKSHAGYDSLSDSLKKMFLNFLSVDYSEDYRAETLPNIDFLIIYEDHEGDRMLVGDVPWEMFLSSVKRLYIFRSPKPKELEGIRAFPPGGMDTKYYGN